MDKELEQTLRYLRLRGLLAHWDEYLTVAEKESFSRVRLLQYVLEEEKKSKQENARKQRLKRAQIREHLVMETYPFDRQPNLNREKIQSMYDSFDFMEKSRNIIWVGPTGCGKTGLATSFLVQAIRRGYTGRYVLFSDLIGELHASVADLSSNKVIKRFLRYDCLLVDELGYIEVESSQIALFFTLMQKRHKRRPTLITSNLGFSEWRSFLRNDHLTAALIDRLTENSYVINMKECITLRPKLSDVHEMPDYPRDLMASSGGR